MSIKLSQKVANALFGKKIQRIPTVAERRRLKFLCDHTKIDERVTKDRRGQIVSRVPVWRYHGWLNGHKEYK